MNHAFMTAAVILFHAGLLAAMATQFSHAMRRWVWFAFAEYLACAVGQLVYSRVIVHGGDTLHYAQSGLALSRLLDANFGWAAPELNSMLFQRPSAFDALVEGGGESNTGSMYAAAAWIIFVLRGSDIAASFLVAGFALLGALGIFRACQDAAPGAPPVRLFVATVMFPSVAFWTSALHKEAFGLMGIGALLYAWRSLYRGRWIRAGFAIPVGLTFVLLFRAPIAPPLLLGIALFFVVDRIQKSRGVEGAVLGPVYFMLALGALAVGMVALSRITPTLGIDRLGETIASKQQGWALSRGGSSFDAVDDEAPQTLAGQLVRVPLALLNALFRPQFFDVNNFVALFSALEMTVLTWFIVRAVMTHGLRGLVVRVQRSPLLLMCMVVTLVGCAFVGLVTLNFGSLARYRVPFLPFYGALVGVVSYRGEAVARANVVATPVRRRLSQRGGRRATDGRSSVTS